MIQKIVIAILVAVIVGLLCIFLGTVLGSINAPITEAIAGFLKTWGWAIGVIAGLWYFFAGGLPSRTP